MSLLFEDQTLDSLQSRDLWLSLCPFLSISEDRAAMLEQANRSASGPRAGSSLLGQALIANGYFRLPGLFEAYISSLL